MNGGLDTGGGVQSGTSRAHFEMWCEDRRNGVIIADFAVQGTLAREILGSPSEIMTRAGIKARIPYPPYFAIIPRNPIAIQVMAGCEGGTGVL